MRVNEIFFSIQGESRSSGLPTIFIRFTGCNLRCTYCDTEYAFYEGTAMTPEDVMSEIAKYRCKRVCITGGEPLIQPRDEMQILLNKLADANYEVSIETSGSIKTAKFTLHPKQRYVLDMKTPSSGMSRKMDLENLQDMVADRDELKFVVGSREDYEWAKSLLEEHGLDPRQYAILFSPVWGKVDLQDLVSWILEDGLDVRFQLQIHKIVWDPATRSV